MNQRNHSPLKSFLTAALECRLSLANDLAGVRVRALRVAPGTLPEQLAHVIFGCITFERVMLFSLMMIHLAFISCRQSYEGEPFAWLISLS